MSRLVFRLTILFCLWQGVGVTYGQHPIGFFNGPRSPHTFNVSPLVEKAVYSTLKENDDKIQFVENKGQDGLSTDVLAYFTTRNEIVFIEKDRLRIMIARAEGASEENGLPEKYDYNSFSIIFKGAQGLSSIEKIKANQTSRTFLNTEASIPVSAKSYGEIILKNVYRGIDLRLYSAKGGHLEFDWVVWPGSNFSSINMELKGQSSINLASTGSLEIKLPMGTFKLRIPESYYNTPGGKQKVWMSFRRIGENEIGFRSAIAQDSRYPLVIDPDLKWGTFFDGGNASFDQYLYSIHFDESTNLLYCAGAANLQITRAYVAVLSGAFDSSFSASTDVLIYTLTEDGRSITHITYYGGSGADIGTGISVNGSYVFVCGYTSSSDLNLKNPAVDAILPFDSTYGGSTDGFVAVFNKNLDQLVYGSFLGASGTDKAFTIRANTDNSFYVSLSVKGALPTASPNYLLNFADNSYSGTSDAWLAKFTGMKNLSFGTYVGGTSDDLINDFQVLSSGDLVFVGNTKGITEVNGTIPDNGSGQEALFGRLTVPASGSVSFQILDRIGGNSNDYAWGMYCMGDSVSIVVGQTNSSNFPLGTGTPFQNTKGSLIDGFMAKIYNNGSAGYRATFVGGNSDDILVSVRPVVVNTNIALLGFGSTQSTNLDTRNFNAGSFFSSSNAGGLDMMFVITNIDLNNKYYLSYIGGSGNDYLGATGAPVGSNHLFYDPVDSVLYLGTTTHSSETTHVPLFVGRGPGDEQNLGIPVFDQVKNNGSNDTHVIIALSTKSLFVLLPLHWNRLNVQRMGDCSRLISWEIGNETALNSFTIERSLDGIHFSSIGEMIFAGLTDKYNFEDKDPAIKGLTVYYRVVAHALNGKKEISSVLWSSPCQGNGPQIKILPTMVNDHFSIQGLGSLNDQNILLELYNSTGQLILKLTLNNQAYERSVQIPAGAPAGVYILSLKGNTGKSLLTQKLILSH